MTCLAQLLTPHFLQPELAAYVACWLCCPLLTKTCKTALCDSALCRDGTPSEKADALKAQLVASIGSQNIVMYGVEGVREVTAAIMAGFAFVATGNLAAPLAGSMAAQVRGCCERLHTDAVCQLL